MIKKFIDFIKEGALQKENIDVALDLFLNVVEKWDMEENEHGDAYSKSRTDPYHIYWSHAISNRNLHKEKGKTRFYTKHYKEEDFADYESLVLNIYFGNNISRTKRYEILNDVRIFKGRLDALGYLSAYWTPDPYNINIHVATTESNKFLLSGFPSSKNGHPPEDQINLYPWKDVSKSEKEPYPGA